MKRGITVLCAFALACGVALADAPATASWVGGGDRDVITDPDNWQCFDAGGNVIREDDQPRGTHVAPHVS